MSKEKTLEQIKVMQAYVDGKEIEFFYPFNEEWRETKEPQWVWDEIDYRVKQEPEYVPFTLDDDLESLLGKAVRHRKDNYLSLITGVDKTDNTETFYIAQFWFSLHESFKYFTFADGKPFGKLK